METDALFSPARRYRYRLWRTWNPQKPRALFILLNPSTADELEDDPTIVRCSRRARLWGYGSVCVVNIFAWRATDPRELPTVQDPVGESNNYHILACARTAGIIVCGWGEHGKLPGRYPHRWATRHEEVLFLLDNYPLHCLARNKSGYPGHPLYLPYSAKPIQYS